MLSVMLKSYSSLSSPFSSKCLKSLQCSNSNINIGEICLQNMGNFETLIACLFHIYLLLLLKSLCLININYLVCLNWALHVKLPCLMKEEVVPHAELHYYFF